MITYCRHPPLRYSRLAWELSIRLRIQVTYIIETSECIGTYRDPRTMSPLRHIIVAATSTLLHDQNSTAWYSRTECVQDEFNLQGCILGGIAFAFAWILFIWILRHRMLSLQGMRPAAMQVPSVQRWPAVLSTRLPLAPTPPPKWPADDWHTLLSLSWSNSFAEHRRPASATKSATESSVGDWVAV